MPDFNAVNAILLSIHVGMPKSYGRDGATDPHDLPWTTGFYKSPVSGPVYTGAENLAGDGQADPKHHGGVDKAVLVYSAGHYQKWRDELALPDLPFGAFGENFTISGLSEELLCIGDKLRIGPAAFEVSQPRQPCWKLARRWRIHELPGYVVTSGRTGWYLRVIEEGHVEAGLPVALIERPNPDWTLARANQIMHHRKSDLHAALELAAVPGISNAWARELSERARQLRAATVAG